KDAAGALHRAVHLRAHGGLRRVGIDRIAAYARVVLEQLEAVARGAFATRNPRRVKRTEEPLADGMDAEDRPEEGRRAKQRMRAAEAEAPREVERAVIEEERPDDASGVERLAGEFGIRGVGHRAPAG